MNGAQILIAALINNGVKVLFGYPGGTILQIYDALFERRDELRHVVTSHEQGAGHAADGYARATGETGVVLATSGPGATNLVTALAAAYHDSVPVVAITGNVERRLIGRDSFQEVDITGITNPIVKHNYMLNNADELESTVREAFVIANSGRKGPVLIDIPKDIAAAQGIYRGLPHFECRPNPPIDENLLVTAADAVERAEKPLILCGGGVVFSDASARLATLSQRLDAPICTTMMGLSAIPSDYSRNLGLIGMHGTYTASVAINTCDLLIAVGTRFSDRVAGNFSRFAENADIVHIDIDRSEISKNVRAAYPVVGDANEVLERLCDKTAKRPLSLWTEKLLYIKARHPVPDNFSKRLDVREIISRLGRIAGDELITVTDVGQHQLFTAQYSAFKKPRSFISSCGLGAMGYGMGAAIGAKLGKPDSPVVLVTGDGSFHMNMGELACAVSEKLPIIVLVMNNKTLGMVYQWQQKLGRTAYTDIDRKTDYAALADALGAKGMRLSSRDMIDDVLSEALSQSVPCVIDCDIEPTQAVERLSLEDFIN